MILRVLAATAALLVLVPSRAAPAQDPPPAARETPAATMNVTLLGTGTPLPLADRFGPATLVEAGKQTLLFDCGRGCAIRLYQKGTILRNAKLFLTHLHFDHIVGIPDLWLTGWLPTLHPGDFTAKPLRIFGPEGTTAMMTNLRQAYAADIALRASPYLAPPAFESVEIAPGIVYEQDGVKVTAFEVDHGLGARASYGYRVDWNGRSVVISGDTKFSPAVLAQATGADLLVHEIAMVKNPEIAKLPVPRAILAVHTTPEEAGRLFAAAKPRLAVYTHFAVAGQLASNAPTPADYLAATRATYDGPLEAGEDLMTIRIGETITVERAAPSGPPATASAAARAASAPVSATPAAVQAAGGRP